MDENNRAPLPWRFLVEDGAMKIKDARGNTIMCDERYYPWCPDSPEDWKMIVEAVNAHSALPQLSSTEKSK